MASASTMDVTGRIAALDQMEQEPLRAEWLRLYRSAAPPKLSRDLLIRGIAYRLQEVAYGGLRPAAKRKLANLIQNAGSAAAAASSAALQPGAVLVRTWHGHTHTVQVLANGFEHDGRTFRSLSQIARAITGAHWSGPRFFGLDVPPAESVDEAA